MSSLTTKNFLVQKPGSSEGTFRTARRVILNADILKASKLSTGDAVIVANGGSTPKAFAVGVLWPSTELSQDSVLVSQSLFLTACLAAGQQVQLIPLTLATEPKVFPGFTSLKRPQEAQIIRLKEIQDKAASLNQHLNNKVHQNWLILLLRECFVDLKYLTSSQVLEILYEGQTRRFVVVSVSATRDVPETPNTLVRDFDELSINPYRGVWYATWDTLVVLLKGEQGSEINPSKKNVEHLAHTSINEAYASVGGLNKQIEEIRDLLEIPLTRPELFRHFGLKPPRGILLHGPPGTGKTHLARAIAASTNSSVLVINGPELSSAYHGETESKLRDVFREARAKSPCIVVLDEVDALAPRREDGSGNEVEKRVVATLLTLMDGMEAGEEHETRVVVIATTNRPNAIDPALRRPGRFDREIEIGVPDAEARFSILKVLLSKTPHTISRDDLHAFASRAHGYVGADLSAIVRQAGTIAIKRSLASGPNEASQESLRLTTADLSASMPSVRPSAMRSLFVETPRIRYSDIGGQSLVIQKLREAVEWPLLHPEAFQRLGVRPPKGVLLYGPPGCSKTILARACACEGGVNFVAVKGPELLNKYVGESERAVRELFRKARTASPCIVFFDEIDALAVSRSSDGESSSSHEGVLTSLLNEMDGVQELVGVTVIAATNRPEALDSALMRPGRLDRLLYVGPPDQSGREEILRIKLRTMTVADDINIEELGRLTEGCSGAEIAAMCQEAALLTMRNDISAPHIPHVAFVTAAGSMQRQITAEVLERFVHWQASGYN
ncbi:AAA-domain-containing protein [Pluteus cervinus]|uniref:AAA-domain-containing protein n=1 Tax=Pluteus cervinus TaxID=181527 RepID=A0ACD3ARU8_9AGAR|nr:AAA-domain-containing protein [Pluteus cervinus]